MPQVDSNTFIGIAGIVVGIVVATFFFVIGKKKTLLQYQKISTQLTTKKMTEISGINIAINGRKINGLMSTTIQFTLNEQI